MKNKMIMLAVLFSVFSYSAHANDQSSGCGLGWELFKKNSLVSSFLRSITNALASNTLAMTTGTSGCAKHDIVMKHKEALYYAEANYQKLQSEMAEGQGEHLNAFAKILGCNGSAAQQAESLLQNHYDAVFTSDHVAPYEMLNNTAHTIYTSKLNCSLGV